MCLYSLRICFQSIDSHKRQKRFTKIGRKLTSFDVNYLTFKYDVLSKTLQCSNIWRQIPIKPLFNETNTLYWVIDRFSLHRDYLETFYDNLLAWVIFFAQPCLKNSGQMLKYVHNWGKALKIFYFIISKRVSSTKIGKKTGKRS